MRKGLKLPLLSLLSAALLVPSLAACGGGSGGTQEVADSPVQKIIEQAQNMSRDELYKKAIEESKGKTMNGIGNSSRGSVAAESFIKELQKIDSSYDGKIEWSQPKNNSIFETLSADINGKSDNKTYSMTLIQDGNQIQSKMLKPKLLLNYLPKEYKEAQGVDAEKDGNPLTLQTLIKVFMVNDTNGKQIKNCWDFVAKGERPLFMGVNSEPIGKNFLYMLTSEQYSTKMKEAFEALPQDQQAYFKPTIEACAKDAEELELTAPDAKYGLAWVKLWCSQYNEMTDDGPICNQLVQKSAAGETGLLVYSKLRSIEESAEVSVNNVKVSAYQEGYKGIGGYGYKHYLLIPRTSPLPWTACAFIHYMTTQAEGFAAWGKDIGGYSSNPACNKDHSKDGYVDGADKFPNKNDRGYDWWAKEGGIVLEDPVYCAETAVNMSDWIDGLIKH